MSTHGIGLRSVVTALCLGWVACLPLATSAAAITVRGTVIDTEGGPVPGAQVWAVQQRTPIHTTADDAGAFTIEGVAVGALQVIARAEGYALGGMAGNAIADGDITIVLPPPDSLGIRVVTEGFEPIAGARLLTVTINNQFRVPVDDLTETGFPAIRSDAEGHLAIPWVPAGGFVQLTIGHHRHAQTLVPYLGTGLDQHPVVLRPGHPVGGRVVDAAGEPVAGARVSIFTRTGSGLLELAQPRTAPDGFYTARVRPGEYFAVARHPDHAGPMPVPLVVTGEEDGPVRPAVISMLPPASVRGRIHFDEDGNPAPAVRVQFVVDGIIYSQAITNAEGYYTLDTPPAPGMVQVTPPAGYFLPEGPGAAVVPVAETTVEAAAFALAPLPRVRGRVLDRAGDPVPRAILSTYDLPTPLHTVADDEGRFEVPLAFAPEWNTLNFRVEHPSLFERALFAADLADRGEQTVQLDRYEPDVALRREEWAPPNDLSNLLDQPAPAWHCEDWYHTEPLRPADLRGKVIVLTFWGGFAGDATAPDRIAEMSALHAAMPADQVAFVAIHDSASLPEDVAAYVRDFAIPFPVGQDVEAGDTFRAYGITVIPQTVLIDRAGRIRHFDVDARLPELIKALLR